MGRPLVCSVTTLAAALLLTAGLQAGGAVTGAPRAAAATACAPWSATTAYTGGDTVVESGTGYRANWWTQGDRPSQHAGGPGSGQPWTAAPCSGGTGPTPTPTPVPTPTPTPQPTPTPSPTPAPDPSPSSTGLATHALIGYWHDFTNPSGPTFPLSQVDPAWDVIDVAFAEDAQDGNVSFTLDPGAGGEARFVADVRAKQAQGKKVVLSLGGQNGSVSVGDQRQADNFAASTAAIMRRYGFDGIDVDLESGVSVGAPITTWLPVGIKELKAKVGAGFYLSMAPEWVYVEGAHTAFGGPWGAYLPMIEALRGDLTVLHPQYYNNGAVYTPYSSSPLVAGSTDQLVATARMLIEGFDYGGGRRFAGLRADQVAFGVPSGPSSAGSGFTTPAQVDAALDCVTVLRSCGTVRPTTAHPTLRGVMTWSINWDRHDGYAFSRPVGAHLRSL